MNNTTRRFHEKCDNKGATIVVVKIKGSEKIVGGYNPFDWDISERYKITRDSFIFSFTNRMNIKTVKVGYSNGVCSIGCYSTFGPVFGGYFYSIYSQNNDDTIWKINDNNFSISYSNIGIPMGRVDVDDYEL